jgi:hypothetical protein
MSHPVELIQKTTRLKLSIADLQRYQQSGLYRHFNAEGRLLYVGETTNFIIRTTDHLRRASWRDEIHAVELEPMSKEAAQALEPRIIATELPLHNRKLRPTELWMLDHPDDVPCPNHPDLAAQWRHQRRLDLKLHRPAQATEARCATAAAR